MANWRVYEKNSIEPWIVVGLGGVGGRVASRISRRLKGEPFWQRYVKGCVEFVLLDTHMADLLRREGSPDEPDLRCGLARFDKPELIEEHKRVPNVQLAHFLHPDYEPRRGGGDGAGQIRMESRFSFYFSSESIAKNYFTKAVERVLGSNPYRRRPSKEGPGRINVLMIFSVAGGTGSGSFLPAAYLMDKVIRDSGYHPRIFAATMLSPLFGRSTGSGLEPKVHANSYAALKEIEYLEKLGYGARGGTKATEEDFVFWRAPNKEIPRVGFPPFFNVTVFDSIAPDPGPRIEDRLPLVADAIYGHFMTEAFDAIMGDYDNHNERTNNHLTVPQGQPDGLPIGFTNRFGTCGAAFLVLPEQPLARYCVLRGVAATLQRQLSMEVDGDPDLSAKLASFRVDTSAKVYKNADEPTRARLHHKAFQTMVEVLADTERRDAERLGTDVIGRWASLVERVCFGRKRPSGISGQGASADGPGPGPKPGRTAASQAMGAQDPSREDSLLTATRKTLAAAREAVFKASLSAGGYRTIQEENFGKAAEVARKLETDFAVENQRMRDAQAKIVGTARFGDVVREVARTNQLGGFDERYFMICLRNIITEDWLPEAQRKENSLFAKGEHGSRYRPERDCSGWNNDLEGHVKSLQTSAPWTPVEWAKRRNQDFENSKTAFGTWIETVVTTCVAGLNAGLEAAQLQAVLEYLNQRLDAYRLVSESIALEIPELERRAEMLMGTWEPPQHEMGVSAPPLYANRIEALCKGTSTSASDRLWDRYFLKRIGPKLANEVGFAEVASAVSDQFRPKMDELGSLVPKTPVEIVSDIVDTVSRIVRARVDLAIEGDQASREAGLTLVDALRFEHSEVSGLHPPGPDAGETRRREYETAWRDFIEDKFKTLHERVRPMADLELRGVADDHLEMTVLLRHPDSSQDILQEVLDHFETAHISTVHWKESKIIGIIPAFAVLPVSAFTSVTRVLEPEYVRYQSGELVGSDLHIDWRWERTLPDLNPDATSTSVNVCLDALARGLVYGLIEEHPEGYRWNLLGGAQPIALGTGLADWLYHLGVVWANRRDPHDARFELLLESIARAEKEQPATRLMSARSRKLQSIQKSIRQMETTGKRLLASEVATLEILRLLAKRIEGLTTKPWSPHVVNAAKAVLDPKKVLSGIVN